MKTVAFVLSLGCALLVVGCSPPAPSGDSEKRLKALEGKVATLQQQNSDVRAKLKAFHGFPGRSPLGDFFASPEFWQCTYDSAWSDCADRCGMNSATSLIECNKKPEGPDRQKCVQEAADAASKCLMACPVQTSPTDPTSCSPSGPA